MRARYYNPKIQRFINVDPIRDGYNWYGYVEGKPILNIDASGLTLFVDIDETGENRGKIVELLQQLTDYVLIYDPYTGSIKMSTLLKNPDSNEIQYKYGNALLREIIRDPRKCMIKTTTGVSRENDNNGESRIFLNLSENYHPKILVDNGKGVAVLEKKHNNHITLAHELIHAYHTMKGITMSKDDYYSEITREKIKLKKPVLFYMYDQTGKINTYLDNSHNEELYTVGLIVNPNNINDFEFTENLIRWEQGLPQRLAYTNETNAINYWSISK